MTNKNTRITALAAFLISILIAAPSGAATFEHQVPARKNDGFSQALFRLWLPEEAGPVRGIIVESGNGGTAFWKKPDWQAFAQKHKLAMLSHFVNGAIPQNKMGYENGPIYEVPFNQAMQALATDSKHPEIALAPLLTFGPCEAIKGGFFPWRKTSSPRMAQRVIAFAVTDNWYQLGAGFAKERINATMRDIPGLLFVPQATEAQYALAAKGIFAFNRKQGAPWCLAVPDSRESKATPLLMAFFEASLAQRVPPPVKAIATGITQPAAVQLKAVDERLGWLGSLKTKEVSAAISYVESKGEAVWFPDEATAKLWQAFVSEK